MLITRLRAQHNGAKIMTTLNITFTNDTNIRFPVYCRYGMQRQAQPAYITLDLEDGECTAWYNGEIGSSPARHWHGIVLTFSIPATTTSDEIESIIEKYKDKFQTILNDSEVEWNGSNRVGVLGENAKSIVESLHDLGHESEACIIEDSGDLENFFGEEALIKDGETLTEYESRLDSADGESNYWFADNFNALNTALCMYEQRLSDFEEDDKNTWIPSVIAEELKDRGCNEYAEELNIILAD
jgi:hypothetical protein